jgi:hypothetical protein
MTDEVKREREIRINNYAMALEKNIQDLRLRGVEPIVLTPVCYNEDIVEKTEIQTDKDSKEKANIKNTLFSKASFRNINEAMRLLSEICKEIAKKYDVAVWDLFAETKAQVDNSCFQADGIHYNEKGHWIIAQATYKNMFGEPLEAYPVTEAVKELSQMEADERAYFFVKYNLVFLSCGRKDGEELANYVQEFIQAKGYVQGLTRARAEGFFRFSQSPTEKQREIVAKIKQSVY